jgi:hypothetical protein
MLAISHALMSRPAEPADAVESPEALVALGWPKDHSAKAKQ